MFNKRSTWRVAPVISELCVKSMLSAAPSWEGSARQTLRNARTEYNLQKLADKMFRRQGEVRERRRYERLYERNSSVSAMTPRSLNTFIPGILEMQDALYPGLPSILVLQFT